jgi:hydroxysqualene dehydroxylase
MTPDTVIIGGGLSGLSAAVELASAGRSLILFEQAPKFGGRCTSYIDATTGDTVDNGQHVLIGAYHNLFRYLEIIGTRNCVRFQPSLELPFDHPTKGKFVFRIPRLPKPFHLTAGVLRFGLLSLTDRRRLMKVGLSLKTWNQGVEERLTKMTIAEWLTGLGQSAEVLRCFWYPLALSIMNEVPERSCAVLFARAMRKAFFGKQKDASMVFPVVGQSELYVTGAERFLCGKRSEIRTGIEVESIIVTAERVRGVRLKDGTVIPASSVISTVPPRSLAKLIPREWKHLTPFSHLHAFDTSPIISINLWFDRPVMKDLFVGIIGKNLQWLFNRRAIFNEEDETAYCTGVISGGREMIGFTKEKLVACAVRDIHSVYPESRKARLVHSVVIREKRATFSPTCEIEPLRPGAATPVGGFFLAGDWTNTGYPATIEGAVISGMRAADAAGKYLQAHNS